MTDTSIEWTDKTWNPVRGCSRVSEGCRNCYAERMAGRFSGKGQMFEGFAKGTPHDYHGQSGKGRTNGTWRWTGKVALIPSKLGEPLRWRKPKRIFVNSMSDLFHEALSFHDIAAVYGVMVVCPQHTFQILTKRPERRLSFMRWMSKLVGPKDAHGNEPVANMATDPIMGALIAADQRGVRLPPQPLDRPKPQWPLPNVWEGVSIEDQATANQRLYALAATHAAKRFVSYEPALGPVDFTDGPSDTESTMGTWSMLDGIDWLIYGGESGPHARSNDIAWAYAAKVACRAAGTAFFMKQLGARPVYKVPGHDTPYTFVKQSAKGGEMVEWPQDLRVREFPK